MLFRLLVERLFDTRANKQAVERGDAARTISKEDDRKDEAEGDVKLCNIADDVQEELVVESAIEHGQKGGEGREKKAVERHCGDREVDVCEEIYECDGKNFVVAVMAVAYAVDCW